METKQKKSPGKLQTLNVEPWLWEEIAAQRPKRRKDTHDLVAEAWDLWKAKHLNDGSARVKPPSETPNVVAATEAPPKDPTAIGDTDVLKLALSDIELMARAHRIVLEEPHYEDDLDTARSLLGGIVNDARSHGGEVSATDANSDLSIEPGTEGSETVERLDESRGEAGKRANQSGPQAVHSKRK